MSAASTWRCRWDDRGRVEEGRRRVVHKAHMQAAAQFSGQQQRRARCSPVRWGHRTSTRLHMSSCSRASRRQAASRISGRLSRISRGGCRAREQSSLRGVQVLLAANSSRLMEGLRQIGQRWPTNSPLRRAPGKTLFEGEMTSILRVFLHQLDAFLLPAHNCGLTRKPLDTEPLILLGQLEWMSEIDEHSDVGARARMELAPAELAVDARQVADDFVRPMTAMSSS